MPHETDKCQELAHSKSTDILAVAREGVAREILIRWQSSPLRSLDEAALAYADAAIEAFLSVLQEKELPQSAKEAARLQGGISYGLSLYQDQFWAIISELSRLHKERK